MLAFLVLHMFGLGSAIAASVVYGMWDLVLVNSLVFLVLVKMETVLCVKRYTVPLPVYADGTVGAAQPRETETVEPVELMQPIELATEPLEEPQLTTDFEVVAA